MLKRFHNQRKTEKIFVMSIQMLHKVALGKKLKVQITSPLLIKDGIAESLKRCTVTTF